MANKATKIAANQNGEILQNASGADFQAGYAEVTETRGQSSALETMLDRAGEFRKQQAQNDNNGDNNGGDYPGPANFGCPAVVENAIDEENSLPQVYIDINEVAKKTHISKKELAELCSGNSKSVSIPTDLTDLTKFITVSQGHASTAGALAKRKILPPETRTYFLKRAQEYGYLWLKGEVQLGNEIRKIVTRMGKRTDLEAANDNKKKQKNTADFGKVLTELRTKKEILTEDYGIGNTQARQLTRLTDELVEKELKYAVANNDTLSRNHALSFLSQPPELTDEEKEEADTTGAKAKFKFETIRSTIPFEQRKKRKLKQKIPYCHLFACAMSDGYYLEQHGFECVLANERETDIAEYCALMYPKAEVLDNDFRVRYNELVKKFKTKKCEFLVITPPCQTFCPQKPKNWRDDDRLTLIIDIVRFIKETRPKHILLENAKAFFSFSLPLDEDLTEHPIAEKLQKILNGRTIGDYLRDELTVEDLGYHVNFAIEDSCFYGCAQSRVRSIMLASTEGVWKWPCAEEFAMSLRESTIDSIFSALNEWLQSDKVKNIITGLAELQKLHTISEYGWCICDEELRDKISSEGSISEDKIDNLIVSYYAKNNYEKLKEKLEMWEKAPFLKERMPIIKSCLYATDKIDGEILFNMAIPTLLAQEDGILEDMYNLIPEDNFFSKLPRS